MKKLDVNELLVSKAARDALPIAQLNDFVTKIIQLTRGYGTNKIPKRPADLAYKLASGRWHHARHLDFLSDRLEALHRREILGLIVSMPPRHGKSTLIDVNFPVWWLAKNPSDQIGLAGYGEMFARQWGGKVRDLIIEHEDYLNLKIHPDYMAADEWKLTTGGGMIAVGTKGGLTGRGANLLIIDDPIKNEEEALSEVYRESVWNWWQATASTRMEPRGVVLIVATRWHEDDLIGRLLNDMPEQFESIAFPAIAEENDPLGRDVGEMLWPERFADDPSYGRRKAKLSPYWWSALYQQRPSPEGGGVLKEEYWSFYQEMPKDIDEWLQSWELSLKDKDTNDFSVGQVWARKGASNYLVAQVRGHFSLKQVCDHMRQFTKDYPKALAKLVEDTALGPMVKQTLQHEVQGIIPIIPKGSKKARAEAVVPLLEAHNVYLPGESAKVCPRWVRDLIAECGSFPKGAYDDQVDTTTQALARLQPHVWRHDAKEAEEVRLANLPEMTPAIAQKLLFKKHFDRAQKRADRQFGGKRSQHRMW